MTLTPAVAPLSAAHAENEFCNLLNSLSGDAYEAAEEAFKLGKTAAQAQQAPQAVVGAPAQAAWFDSAMDTGIVPAAQQAGAAAPSDENRCRWPVCQPEHVQQQVADQAYRELYSGEPTPQDQGAGMQVASDLLNADELAALRRFDECAQDGEGYDVPKEMMQRLAAIGVVQRRSGAYYQATDFGQRVLASPEPATAAVPTLRLVHELSRISMSLAADLVQGAAYTFQGHDYLDRDAVCERVMQWRHQWDTTAPARDALAQQARASAAQPVEQPSDDGAMWRRLIADTSAQPCKYPSLRDDLADWIAAQKDGAISGATE